METKRYCYGIEFTSGETDIHNIRLSDLLTIAFNHLFPEEADIPSSKDISILLMTKEIKRVEIIKNSAK